MATRAPVADCRMDDLGRHVTTTAILPVHNGTGEIRRALRSIDAQTQAVDDIIVVDDGSSDDLRTELIACGFQGTLIRQRQSGQGAATNRGIRAAGTTHVLFLDHDDEWVHDRVARQTASIVSTGADAVIGGVVNVFHEPQGDEHATREVTMGAARVLGAGLFTRDVFEQVGLLPEDHRIHEIFEWWSRATGAIRLAVSDEPVLRRHVHGGNLTGRAEHRGRGDLLFRVRAHVRRERVGASEP